MFEQHEPKQRNRMIMAIALAGLILVGFDLAGTAITGKSMLNPAHKAEAVAAPQAVPAQMPTMAGVSPSVPVAAMRVPLSNNRVDAEVNLAGGRIDTLTLKKYAEAMDKPAGYRLLKPEGPQAEFVELGWLGAGGLQGPDANAVWQPEPDVNGPGKPLVLVWRNGTGQTFQRVMTMRPDSYVIAVEDRVFNGAGLPVTMTHYAQVQRADGHLPHESSNFVNYIGPMGVAGEELKEVNFDDVKSDGRSETVTGAGGWWGITSQYFMAAAVPLGQAESQRDFRYGKVDGRDFYTATTQQAVTVPAGGQTALTYLVYAGPKQYGQLSAAGHDLEQAISWGWFEPIVKALYKALVWLHGYVGNWGIAIILLTLGLKLLTYPLATKSYVAMARMKKLQPKLEALKERHKDNQQAMALDMMQLYKQEKVNPVSGCWPMLVQIPIFFAMYKVVLVSFEFRHAPLGLWVTDMSVRDPWFVLPVLMGLSMWVQMRLQPPAADPVQQAVFKWMPVMFTVMFLFFPAGLVFYWLVNNIFSIAQQYLILKREKAA